MATALDRPISSLLAAPESSATALSRLYSLADVIEFSEAAAIWESTAAKGRRPRQRQALDQQRFRGTDAPARRYFVGISAIAQRNAAAIASEFVAQGVRFEHLLDFGAGRGDYGVAFLRAGIAANVTCVDLSKVVHSRRRVAHPRLHWAISDTRNAPHRRSRFDAVWISNVLHHYGPADALKILRHLMGFLTARGTLLIHEYVLDASGTQALAAGILGLHFALTTNGGRCYSTSELIGLCRRAGHFHMRYFDIRRPISTVLALHQPSQSHRRE